ncbi:hypothetical protein CHS0354_036921 [Potamilus streckersoni]|uniref:Lipase n=1 Tax=Potamilus streckersoni TaxID=2493646 RepID=A0AAE0W094_9BIVA|nr:hypothetical protein CHS0354_036921 [Potamilus streckersoni]
MTTELDCTVWILLIVQCNTLVGSPLKYKKSLNEPMDPDAYRNASQLITSKGYPCEEHEVHTVDGFILGLQRIPKGKSSQTDPSPPVVLVQHGLLASSMCWLDNLVNESLGYLLADAGFDVWFGNSRGNVYSRKHEKYSPSQREFWDWSWDEMAKYDLPATINYILKMTGAQQLYYIGHSQGTEIGFAQFSQDQDLGKKVKLFIALAPVAFLKYIKSPIRYLLPFASDAEEFLALFGEYDFLPNTNINRWLAQFICGLKIPDFLCENVFFIFGGFDFKQMNMSRVPVYVAHTPAGTSTFNIMHYAQSVTSGNFQMRDFGSPDENMKHYNQTTPPLYDVTKMQTPVALYSGTSDWLGDPQDYARLLPLLRNVKRNKVIEGWEHLDFLWAMDGPLQCYHDLIDLIKLDSRVV